jgi:hypothetical protein
MKTHLVRWHNAYADKGLVVVDVDDGKADAQADLKKDIEESKVPFAVLWDKEAKNVDKYKVEGFPAAYLLGTDGKVVWEGHPSPRASEAAKLEGRIKAELEKVRK